jgi:hypothetical protein
MDRPKLEVADVFRRYGAAYRDRHGGSLSTAQRRVMSAIEKCRTAALGGHLERCDECGHERNSYNSCGDRHCPKCQSLARARWIEDRQAELLEVPYFHVVFTIPDEIAAIAYQNKRVVYGILFRATAETLMTIGADPKHLGARLGFFAVLHSWGQNVLFHPHLHCVVPGGGPSLDGDRWISCRPGFFLPVRVLSRLFRRLFLQGLRKAFRSGKLRFAGRLEPLRNRLAFARHLERAEASEWVVYAKRPFAGPQQVLDYVGRYTHRVAISNNRLLDMEDDQVRFQWKDYRHGDRVKIMSLSADEFIRRFLTQWFSAHSLLRLSRESKAEGEPGRVSAAARHAAAPDPTSRSGLPRPLRGTDRRFVATVSAMRARPHGPGRHPAGRYRRLPDNHRLVMMPLFRFRTHASIGLTSRPVPAGECCRPTSAALRPVSRCRVTKVSAPAAAIPAPYGSLLRSCILSSRPVPGVKQTIQYP